MENVALKTIGFLMISCKRYYKSKRREVGGQSWRRGTAKVWAVNLSASGTFGPNGTFPLNATLRQTLDAVPACARRALVRGTSTRGPARYPEPTAALIMFITSSVKIANIIKAVDNSSLAVSERNFAKKEHASPFRGLRNVRDISQILD